MSSVIDSVCAVAGILVEIDATAHYYIVAVGDFPPRAALQKVQGWGIMVGTDISEVGYHIGGAPDHVVQARHCVLPHLRWELEQVMLRVRPQDLSAAEVAGLLAILRPAHSRVIGGPTSRLALVVRGAFAVTPS